MRTLLRAIMRIAFVIGLCSVSFGADESQQKSTAKPTKADGVAATVVTDGAIVYVAPDVDSSVITMLPQGQKIRISKGTTAGPEKFHKIRVGGRIGYIAAIDITLGSVSSSGAGKSAARDAGAKKKKKGKSRDSKPKMPIYFSRFVGALVGMTEFKESISGVNSSESLLMYGLKITGPDLILGGPVVDFNLALHYGAPSYYNALSQTKPSGFILLTDLNILLPIMQGQNIMFYLGLGPVLSISQFNVVNSGRKMDLTSFSIGADAELGCAFRIEKIALRLDAKYYVEKESYKAVQAAVQTEF